MRHGVSQSADGNMRERYAIVNVRISPALDLECRSGNLSVRSVSATMVRTLLRIGFYAGLSNHGPDLSDGEEAGRTSVESLLVHFRWLLDRRQTRTRALLSA